MGLVLIPPEMAIQICSKGIPNPFGNDVLWQSLRSILLTWKWPALTWVGLYFVVVVVFTSQAALTIKHGRN